MNVHSLPGPRASRPLSKAEHFARAMMFKRERDEAQAEFESNYGHIGGTDLHQYHASMDADYQRHEAEYYRRFHLRSAWLLRSIERTSDALRRIA